MTQLDFALEIGVIVSSIDFEDSHSYRSVLRQSARKDPVAAESAKSYTTGHCPHHISAILQRLLKTLYSRVTKSNSSLSFCSVSKTSDLTLPEKHCPRNRDTSRDSKHERAITRWTSTSSTSSGGAIDPTPPTDQCSQAEPKVQESHPAGTGDSQQLPVSFSATDWTISGWSANFLGCSSLKT